MSDAGIQEGIYKTGKKACVVALIVAKKGLKLGLKALINHLKKSDSKSFTQIFEDGEYKYAENKIPGFKNDSYEFDKEDEDLLKKHLDKYDVKYHIENIDENKNKIVFLSKDKESMIKALEGYLKDLDKDKTKDKKKYKDVKRDAEEKMNKEKSEKSQDKERSKEHKKEKNFEVER